MMLHYRGDNASIYLVNSQFKSFQAVFTRSYLNRPALLLSLCEFSLLQVRAFHCLAKTKRFLFIVEKDVTSFSPLFIILFRLITPPLILRRMRFEKVYDNGGSLFTLTLFVRSLLSLEI